MIALRRKFLRSFSAQAGQQSKWLQFFENPSLWWDYRQCKEEPNHPDFVHEVTGENLWIDPSSCDWIQSKIRLLESSTGAATKARYRNNANFPQENGKLKDSETRPKEEALRFYENLRREGRTLPVSVTLAALKFCISNRDLKIGRRIHLDVTENHQELHAHIANTLVDMYAKCGSMSEARQVFDGIKLRSVVSWNAIIMGYASNGDGEQALELFARMLEEGFVPDSRIFVAALKACTNLTTKEEGTQVGTKYVKTECLKRGRAIHAELAKRGHESDVYVASTLVDFYAKCGSMSDARSIFNKMQRFDVVACTALILGYAESGEGELGMEFFARMLDEGFKADPRIFVAGLKACGSAAAQDEDKGWKIRWLEKGRAMHDQLAKIGYENNIYVAASLVDMYTKCGSIENSRQVFNRIPQRQRNVHLWNSIIMAYAQSGNEEMAMDFYESMKVQGVLPDARTMVVALTACTELAVKDEGKESGGETSKATCLQKGRSIHLEAVKNKLEKDIYVTNTLLDFYSKCGSMVDARRVFDEMKYHSSVSWAAIISGYAHNGEEEVALELYERMKAEGTVVSNGKHVVPALRACGRLAALEVGRKIHDEIRVAGLGDDVMVTNALIHFYGKCGSMVDAQQVFDNARTKSLVTWNALIAGYTHQGDTGNAFKLFARMKKEKVLPNEVTFLELLNVCTHAGLVEKGKEVFEDMRSQFLPSRAHYTCMIDLLGRANHLEEALGVVKSMPWKPDPTLWRTVLGACQKWSNAKVGKIAFDCLVELDKEDATAYVLMANIYTGAKMWNESAKLQATRNRHGV